MLDLADVSLLLLLAIIGAGGLLYTVRLTARHAAQAERYKLFAVRDALVRLVAEGKLKEEDPVFLLFYRASNIMIRQTDGINLKNFVSALEAARTEGVDPAVADAAVRIHQEVDRKPEEVGRVVNAFYAAVLDILFRNSWVLRVRVKCQPLFRLLGSLGGRRHLPPTQRRAYTFYQDYSRAASELKVAA